MDSATRWIPDASPAGRPDERPAAPGRRSQDGFLHGYCRRGRGGRGVAGREPGRDAAHLHQLRGGTRRRVMMVVARAAGPSTSIADDPPPALDARTQAKVLALLKDRQGGLGGAVFLIPHDRGVVGETADRVAVMY